MTPQKAVAKSAKTPVPYRTQGYEFGGPYGVTGLTILITLVPYVLILSCNDISGCPAPALLSPRTLTWEALKPQIGWPATGIQGFFTLQALGWTLAYFLLSLTLFSFLPGQEAQGIKLRNGGRLDYKFNGFLSTIVTAGAAAIATAVYGADMPVWTFIWEQYVPILTANLLISVLLANYTYLRSFSVRPKDKELRELSGGAQTGNAIYDWFMGRELNSRVDLPIFGEIDIKAWCEMRPGLLGWILINVSNIAAQYRMHGFVSDSILFTTAFQAFYVLDALYMEPAILTTMDITTDGFGFMLSFGDLVWVPFIYSLQTRYLAIYPLQLGVVGIAGILAVQAVGYYIFRSTNNEKNRFRTNPQDPAVAHLESIDTPSGSKLLTTGWWGRARHINYLGDFIMGWSYCLPTGLAGFVVVPAGSSILGSPLPPSGPVLAHAVAGAPGSYPLAPSTGFASSFATSFTSSSSSAHATAATGAHVIPGPARGWGTVITYFYMVYFAILLIHRERRDDEKCHRKHGKAWEEYRRRVPWRIVPYVY